ncbi:kynureninase [Homoserinimonas sp. OAct 916]|uniref:kynureninase n=1 Tax=Homoserinimonas sp. OAct 916 TaxID=2211450 RepID=UPI000DBE43AB|nr:kynureninase [Homoserinimonas sp. OAct 916]
MTSAQILGDQYQEATAAGATALDAADPLASYGDRFITPDGEKVIYLDGNSLGRPPAASADRINDFVRAQWGTRLIRGWTDGWMDLPQIIGDRLGSVMLGAAAGQVTVGDSTTVMLYKLIRAAVDAHPERREILIDTDNFPTDRFIVEGIAAERGLTVRWIQPDPTAGVTVDQVVEAVTGNTALVVLSHVSYRSGYLADMEAITRAAHDVGALILWDLCHSVGVIPTQLDAWGVDLAVGCTYKYLNGGPGSPAFGYVRSEHQSRLPQPIWGWLGREDPFEMEQGYQVATGIRGFISGTPSILGMLAMQDTIDMIDEVGITAVRAKSVQLTEYAVMLVNEWLVPRGVEIASPLDPERRGGHITINHDSYRAALDTLWDRNVIPDFRTPNGLRLGLSPLSTSFADVYAGVDAIHEVTRAAG